MLNSTWNNKISTMNTVNGSFWNNSSRPHHCNHTTVHGLIQNKRRLIQQIVVNLYGGNTQIKKKKVMFMITCVNPGSCWFWFWSCWSFSCKMLSALANVCLQTEFYKFANSAQNEISIIKNKMTWITNNLIKDKWLVGTLKAVHQLLVLFRSTTRHNPRLEADRGYKHSLSVY